ncbi:MULTISPECIES: TetR/AcrR family transcriptional regulator [Marinobacter]|uniref:TetR/AcrR family transcriptional regulator n=1 Tax=Marinobacter TaxID=2742 RepID=UPI000DAD8C63|nr:MULTISPECIES: TetR/AcrR family transcriptional regulator [Marinobacter]
MSEATQRSKRGRKSDGDKAQLTRDDWLDAAAGEVAAGGFGQLRVLTLSKKLGVTRGSFYWHFKDHEDLVVSFLNRWRDRRFHELQYWKPKGDDPEAELRDILRLMLTDSARNVRRLQVELAVRDFARRNDYAAQLVQEVDESRMNQNCLLFQNLNSEPERIRDLSMLLYVATIGAQVVLTGHGNEGEDIRRVEDMISRIVMERRENLTD